MLILYRYPNSSLTRRLCNRRHEPNETRHRIVPSIDVIHRNTIIQLPGMQNNHLTAYILYHLQIAHELIVSLVPHAHVTRGRFRRVLEMQVERNTVTRNIAHLLLLIPSQLMRRVMLSMQLHRTELMPRYYADSLRYCAVAE